MDPQRIQLIEELNQAVQRSGNLTVLFTHAIAEQIGLSATEFECLDVLGDSGPMTAGQLAEACGLSTGGVTGLVDRLEKAGFVKRSQDTDDRRRVIIEVIENEHLHDKIRALYNLVSEGFNEVVSTYSDTQLRTILDFMNRSSAMIDVVRATMKNTSKS